MSQIQLTPAERREHRAEAHHLDPVVMIGADGLTPAVQKEIDAALNAHESEKVSIKEVGELARAARAAMQARTMSLKEREAIEEHARKRALEDAAATAVTTAKAQGLSDMGVDKLREAIMGRL